MKPKVVNGPELSLGKWLDSSYIVALLVCVRSTYLCVAKCSIGKEGSIEIHIIIAIERTRERENEAIKMRYLFLPFFR